MDLSRGLGDVYKRQRLDCSNNSSNRSESSIDEKRNVLIGFFSLTIGSALLVNVEYFCCRFVINLFPEMLFKVDVYRIPYHIIIYVDSSQEKLKN
jgi:hypothetical protein